MKETKITKRIFAVFVAFIVILLISCGDLQIFADSVTLIIVNNTALTTLRINRRSIGASSWSSYDFARSYNSVTTSFDFDSYEYTIYFDDVYNGRHTYFIAVYAQQDTTFTFTNSNSTTLSNAQAAGIFTPVLSTPTPEPTPTPVPTPTPEPTFNPDQPTYTTFFNHLLNDGNNALNALYLSWTQANNKFYTGIFFIGLPIMIGIFGIVASIFFGGDD